MLYEKETIRPMSSLLSAAGSARVVLLLLLAFFVSCARPEVQPPPNPAKIAIVLGAGASRGFAHIGVLKILEGSKVPLHMIVGTSAGSFVGSLYAYGFNAFQLQKIALSIHEAEIIDYAVPDNGFVKGEKLEAYINNLVQNTPLDKMRIPFHAVATNVQNGREIVFSKGNTGMAVRASCAIPGIFRPGKIDDILYIDGGVVSPVAVDAARRLGADVVIAVDISADLGAKQPEGTIDTILQAIGIMQSRISGAQLSHADIVIRPKVGGIGAADFDKRSDAIMEGEKAALQAIPAIQKTVDSWHRAGANRQ